jgi:hypothetical protein
MDTDEVSSMSRWFQTASNTLKTVSGALRAAMILLQTTALTGLVGGFVLERFIGRIQPPIEELSEYCAEISRDLDLAVRNFQDANSTNAGRFG